MPRVARQLSTRALMFRLGLGQALRDARIAAGLSIKAAAEQIGISRQWLEIKERGQVGIDVDELVTIYCPLYKVSPASLIAKAGGESSRPFRA